jgi:ATP-binding cassette, subfamily G (WHITE), member 2, PDR
MVNEFHNREFDCSFSVPSGPSYQGIDDFNQVCYTVGATPGSRVVQGDAYINSSFEYYHRHKWRLAF